MYLNCCSGSVAVAGNSTSRQPAVASGSGSDSRVCVGFGVLVFICTVSTNSYATVKMDGGYLGFFHPARTHHRMNFWIAETKSYLAGGPTLERA